MRLELAKFIAFFNLRAENRLFFNLSGGWQVFCKHLALWSNLNRLYLLAGLVTAKMGGLSFLEAFLLFDLSQ